MKEIQQYCAFLRGVNTGGRPMKMADVVQVFEKAGMKNVKSVLATGNIIFSSEKSPETLKENLEKDLSESFNYDAFLFIKTDGEVNEILTNNPFITAENFHVYAFVTLLGEETHLQKIFNESIHTEGEEAKTVGTNFYWKIPKGDTLNSTFGKILGRKDLKAKITSRNINTIDKIVKKF